MKLFKYPNGLILKRKNKRTKVLTSLKNPENNFLEFQIYDKEGRFAGFKEERGVQTVTIHLSDETLELLAHMIFDHLTDKEHDKF
jgi:hypothetical protein